MSRIVAFLRSLQRLLVTLRVLVGSGMIAPMRPDKYLRQALVVRRHGANAMSGIGLSAARAPRATALVDERGFLTWAELDRRVDAAGVGLHELLGEREGTLGILCRNHRGLVESLAAATRIGADALLLNTGFSGPQLRDVLEREQRHGRGVRRGVRSPARPGQGAAARADRGARLGRGPRALPSRRTRPRRADRRQPRPAAAEAVAPRSHRAADLGHDRHPQGRTALGRSRRLPGRHARADPVARRRDDCRRGADVPRVGLRAARDLRDDVLHHRDAPPVRPGGDARAGRPQPGDRAGRRTRDARADHRPAREDPRAVQPAPRCGSSPPAVRGCVRTPSPRSWTGSATPCTTPTTPPRPG